MTTTRHSFAGPHRAPWARSRLLMQRGKVQLTGRRASGKRLLASLALMLAVVSCGRKEAPEETAPTTPATRAAAPSPDNKAPDAVPGKARSDRPADERDDELDRAVAAYKREHPFRDANELLKQEAFLEKLRPQLEAAVKNNQFKERVQKSVDLAAQLKEGRVAPGSYRLDLKLDNYTPERTDRLLGTVLSGKPEKLVDFVVSEIDEAALEFTFSSDQDRASNGVTVLPNPPAPAPRQ